MRAMKFPLGVSILGDADFTNTVDNSDIGRVFANFQAVLNPTWADGNFDGNGTVDNADIGTVFANFGEEVTGSLPLLAALTSDPEFADFIYDPFTGGVVLDGTDAVGGGLTNFVLQSDGSFLNAEGVENPFDSVFFTSTANEISASDGSALGLGQLIDLGSILETGLTADDLAGLFTRSSYVGSLGTGQV